MNVSISSTPVRMVASARTKMALTVVFVQMVGLDLSVQLVSIKSMFLFSVRTGLKST